MISNVDFIAKQENERDQHDNSGDNRLQLKRRLGSMEKIDGRRVANFKIKGYIRLNYKNDQNINVL